MVVSLPKSDFYLTETHCCGRIIDENGIRYNPKNLFCLMDSKPPNNESELCEYVHDVSWLLSSIPRFAESVAPLRQLLEKAYAKAGGNRKNRAVAKISLASLGWQNNHLNAFQDLQNRLKEYTELNYRNMSKTLCVHTDASGHH